MFLKLVGPSLVKFVQLRTSAVGWPKDDTAHWTQSQKAGAWEKKTFFGNHPGIYFKVLFSKVYM
jgi:hypothetical protein